MAEQREIHRVLRREFPIRTKVNYVDALDTDLWYLELDAWIADLPCIVSEPYTSEYAKYIESLPVHVMGCHWYNIVFAHLAGGNRAVMEAASSVLPENWTSTSEFLKPASSEEIDGLRDAFEKEAASWTDDQRHACLLETPSAFEKLTRLQKMIFA